MLVLLGCLGYGGGSLWLFHYVRALVDPEQGLQAMQGPAGRERKNIVSHFFSVGERALLRAFGKTERDVLIRYGKSLASKKRKEQKKEGGKDG